MPLSESTLLQMRAAAISGAGLCAAIILVLTQTSNRSVPQLVALWAASLGIPVWLAAWQYVQPYIVQGSESYGHYKQGVAGLLGLAGISTLFVAFTSLVWLVSPCASVAFAFACLIAALFISMHIRAVLGWRSKGGSSNA
jgi:hypothetical protein